MNLNRLTIAQRAKVTHRTTCLEGQLALAGSTDETQTIGFPIAAAIVLCGGRSMRMGTDKATVPFGCETLLQRACRIAGESAECVIVVAAVGQHLPELPHSVRIVRDEFPEAGPLAGMLTGLRFLKRESQLAPVRQQSKLCLGAVWVTSCDTPFVDRRVIECLSNQLGDFDAVCFTFAGYLNPLAAIYRIRCVDVLESIFAQGERKATALLNAVETCILRVDDVSADFPEHTFLNVNTPESLQQARRLLS